MTPAGRLYEQRVLALDCSVLALGVLGLATGSAWLLIVAGTAHLVTRFLSAITKTVWAAMTIGSLALFGLAIVGLAAVADRLSFGGFITAFASNPPLLIGAYFVIVAGLLGKLFALPGIAEQLVEFRNKYGEEP